ncbi:MAG: polyprenyl synthetase family protein [Patescibacteria group bacterium]|nr:polyprenyl synthetase family protein [Patescibacteria group bacterium]MDE2589979.1 polyprenyl synthetase family protein [Patescibacteria group bacterium]
MNILDRYTTKVQTYLHDILNKENFLYRKALYHFGFIDQTGKDRKSVGWGKGLRSTILLLTIDSLKGELWEKAIPVAAAIELFHNATLVVDDWQDKDVMRRGSPAVWALQDVGPEQGINVAFFLTVLSSKVLITLSAEEFAPNVLFTVQSLFEQTKISVIEGQQKDIAFEKVQEIGLDEYLDMIRHKTGVLIQSSILMGALLADVDKQTLASLVEFGNHLGLLFQMRDDFLGVYGDISKTGKPAEDVLHKKKSLPVVLAMEYGTSTDKEALTQIYASQKRDLSNAEILEVMNMFDALHIKDKMWEMIEKEYKRAVEVISKMHISKKDEFLFLTDLFAHRVK